MPETGSTRPAGRRLAGTTALVTGAAGGIGLAIARRFASEGAKVLMTDIDAPRLASAADSVCAEWPDIAAIPTDLARRAERDRLVPAVLARWGRLDILVNNAAYHGCRQAFLDAPEEEFEQVFAVNVMATAALCRGAGLPMRAQGCGSIINLGSIQADLPVATHAAYVASKGAIAALTRALAVELSPSGIRVNAVLPGVIATDAFVRSLAGRAHARERRNPATAALLGREGRSDEVAAAVAFLASAEASFITGTALCVDGGRSISRRPDPFEMAFGGETEPENTR